MLYPPLLKELSWKALPDKLIWATSMRWRSPLNSRASSAVEMLQMVFNSEKKKEKLLCSHWVLTSKKTFGETVVGNVAISNVYCITFLPKWGSVWAEAILELGTVWANAKRNHSGHDLNCWWERPWLGIGRNPKATVHLSTVMRLCCTEQCVHLPGTQDATSEQYWGCSLM